MNIFIHTLVAYYSFTTIHYDLRIHMYVHTMAVSEHNTKLTTELMQPTLPLDHRLSTCAGRNHADHPATGQCMQY